MKPLSKRRASRSLVVAAGLRFPDLPVCPGGINPYQSARGVRPEVVDDAAGISCRGPPGYPGNAGSSGRRRHRAIASSAMAGGTIAIMNRAGKTGTA